MNTTTIGVVVLAAGAFLYYKAQAQAKQAAQQRASKEKQDAGRKAGSNWTEDNLVDFWGKWKGTSNYFARNVSAAAAELKSQQEADMATDTANATKTLTVATDLLAARV